MIPESKKWIFIVALACWSIRRNQEYVIFILSIDFDDGIFLYLYYKTDFGIRKPCCVKKLIPPKHIDQRIDPLGSKNSGFTSNQFLNFLNNCAYFLNLE